MIPLINSKLGGTKMKGYFLKSAFVINFLLCAVNIANSQTYVGGLIDQNTTWTLSGSPYIVQSDITVRGSNSTVTLTIDPGVVVEFYPGTSLIIGSNYGFVFTGKLVASGTSQNPITFTTINEAQPQAGQWSYISFYDYASDESILEYCILDYGKSIELNSASPTISNCNIHDMQYAGIRLYRDSSTSIISNTFSNLSHAIIFSYYYSNKATGNPTISSNTFTECTDYAIDVNRDSDPVITNNTFTNNSAYLISLYPNQVGNVSGNTFSGNNPNMIKVNGGTIARDATWTETDVGYFIYSDIQIEGSGGSMVTLTLERGVKLYFNSGRNLTIGSSGGGAITGKLVANQVTFTTSDQAQPAPGKWGNISFFDYSSNESVLDSCTIEYGRAIDLNSASPTISNCSIHDMQDEGIRLYGNSSPSIISNIFSNLSHAIIFSYYYSNKATGNPTISSNTFTGCTDYAIDVNRDCDPVITNNTFTNNSAYLISLYPDQVGNVSGNTFSGNNPNMIKVNSGTISKDATWSETDVGYFIYSDIRVEGSGGSMITLTLDRGVKLYFNSGIGLTIGSSGRGAITGKLVANQVTFTTSDQAQPAAGKWSYISFLDYSSNESILDSCTIEYGRAIELNSASPTISNCSIHNMQDGGIRLYGDSSPSIISNIFSNLSHAIVFSSYYSNKATGNPTISGNTFTGCTDYAIDVNRDSDPVITNNTFTNNSAYLISLYPNQVGNVSGNTSSGNNPNMIKVNGGTISKDATWSETDVGYFIYDDVKVEGSSGNMVTLTLIAGDTLYFADYSELVIGSSYGGKITGRLIADGVVFTTSDQAQPGPGKWESITLQTYSSYETIISNCTIEYAKYGIIVNNASPQINSNVLRECSYYGIYCNNNASPSIKYSNITKNNIGIYCRNSANPIINFNNITGNTNYGVQNITSTVIVDAKYNWWGDPSGPSGLGPGSGDAVSDYIDYGAWLHQPYSGQPLPPSPFSLLLPDNGDTLTTLSIDFVWEATTDPDPGDVVTYTLYLSTTESFDALDSVSGLTDTTYTWSNLQDNQRYWWKVRAVDTNTSGTWSNEVFSFIIYASINVENSLSQEIPTEFMIYQNYPNPFNPETIIKYAIPTAGQVLLQIYNPLGKNIRTLVNEFKTPGEYIAIWDGKDDYGNQVSSGIYFYQLKAGDFVDVKKMIKLR